MAEKIHRICVAAKPAPTHREFKQWETANVVVFVKAYSPEDAHVRVRDFLKRERWELLDIQLADQLVEALVRENGGEPLALYEKALKEGVASKVFPKIFGAGRDGIPAIRPPRVTETFMDQVVLDVGGERLETDDKNRIVDYRIGNWLFDLKDLQEEGLLKPERQQKLAKLFEPYLTPGQPFQIDPELLNEDELRKYHDIISGPIQTQVKSTSKQVKSTREVLGIPELKGGIIFLNSGYGSFPPEEFGPLVERYVRKDTSNVEAIFCISTWALTNGFDSQIFYRTYPSEPTIPEVKAMREAFGKRFEEAMTQLVLETLPKAAVIGDPLAPVTFQVNGLNFSWLPPELPSSLPGH